MTHSPRTLASLRRRIRAIFGISEREYALSLGPEQILGELLLGTLGSLSELLSEGRSGSFFYFSNDALYLIKTIPHREARSLRRVLPHYLYHLEQCAPPPEPEPPLAAAPRASDRPSDRRRRRWRRYKYTLLPRYLGMHRLTMPGVGKVHFVVMSNIFSTERAIHERRAPRGRTPAATAV